MVSLRLGVVVLLACGACGGVNSGGEGKIVASHDEGGSAMDAATTDAGPIPRDPRQADAGHPDAGHPDAGTDAAAPATWTAIYENLLVNQSYPSNCTGASCHDPGIEKGIDLSTAHMGYTTLLHRLTPGSPDSSELVTVLEAGSMPEDRPHMTAPNIDLIRAWIRAGALEN
jgi:hypothetical protein